MGMQIRSRRTACAKLLIAARRLHSRANLRSAARSALGRPCQSSTFRFIPSIEIIPAGRGPVPRTLALSKNLDPDLDVPILCQPPPTDLSLGDALEPGPL
jgi:hypothetical protein